LWYSLWRLNFSDYISLDPAVELPCLKLGQV
jgi:hypothetical protein